MSEKTVESQAATVALPLSKKNKTLVTIASILFMFYIAGHGTALAMSQTFMLGKIDGMSYLSLSFILITLGAAIVTPIGGKLGDIVGRRTLMVVSGLISFVTAVAMGFTSSVGVYLGLVVLNSLSKGAFTASPYILMNLINERKDIPKANGFLASAIAGGILVGAAIAGVFNDMARTEMGLIINALPILLGSILIFIALPNVKAPTKIKLDLGGIILLTILISSFVLSFNFAPTAGWTNPLVLAGFAVMIISLVLFVKYEKKTEAKNEDPIIAMSLFSNKEYTLLLFVGLIAYFYQTVITSYGVISAQKILNASATMSSVLIMPRTIITLILPAFTGVWLSKKKSNSWKAMAFATGIIALVFAPLMFISPSMSVIVLLVSFSLTGIAESFRAVSITPAAQEILSPENLSTGTALVNFVNTLGSVIASTICGVLYNAAGGDANVVQGMRWIYTLTVVVSLVGLLLVIFGIRKVQKERIKF